MRRRTLVLVLALLSVTLALGIRMAVKSPESAPVPADATPQHPVESVPASTVDPDRPHHADVHCSVEGAPRRLLWGDLYEAEPPLGPEANRRHTVRIEQGWLVFRPLHPENIGILTIRGYRDAKLGWLDGACTASHLLEPQPLTTLAIHALLPEHLDEVSARVHRAGIPEESRVGRLAAGRIELSEPPGEIVLKLTANVGDGYGTIHEEEIDLPEVPVVPIEIDLRDLPPLGWVDVPVNEDLTSPILKPGERLVSADGLHPNHLRYGGLVGPVDQPVVLEAIAEDGTARTIEIERIAP
jgi:hypothetical protein